MLADRLTQKRSELQRSGTDKNCGDKMRFHFLLVAALGFLLSAVPAAMAQSDNSGVNAWDLDEAGEYQQALPAFENACEIGNAQACAMAATYYIRGEKVAQNVLNAKPYAEKACDGGIAPLCDFLGWEYIRGGNWEKDGQRGVDLIEQACRLDDGHSCKTMAISYDDGGGDLIARDPNLSYIYALKTCALAWQDEEFLSEYCEKADALASSGEVTITQSRSALERALCDINLASNCFTLASFHQHGKQGLPVDAALSAELYEKACEWGDTRGCANLGWAHENGELGLETDFAKAMTFYSKACSLDGSVGCENLAIIHETGPEEYRDVDLAVAYHDKACELGGARGCYLLGSAYLTSKLGRQQNDEKALAYGQRGCELGGSDACRLVETVQEIRSIDERNARRVVEAQREARRRDEAERNRLAESRGRSQTFINGLYDRPTEPSQKRVCGMIYQGGRATYECMTEQHYDRYYRP
ncbi:tetratricopeptide repeat protein [Henriciella algicola]|uniref:Sel1 repeat family protein n=1 Tax=Henriciella algicola TaxID=1608422 RepID=A0A399RLL1_9PROT|nr:SEL1-like repeat protein [Henriciella algicola]RIJ31601.1 sel1 repeat family protein [Henriciella algicola]